MLEGVPHITLKRAAWRSIALQAAGHSREAGGLLVGRRTRLGTLVVHLDVALAHIESNKDQVKYDYDEVAKAREAVYSVHGPYLEPVGGWHTHPWPELTMESLLSQISDEDVEEMQHGDIELIVSTIPRSTTKRTSTEFSVVRVISDVVCRGEAYLKVSDDEAAPCTISIR